MFMTTPELLKCKFCFVFSFVQFHTGKQTTWLISPAPLSWFLPAVMATQNPSQVHAGSYLTLQPAGRASGSLTVANELPHTHLPVLTSLRNPANSPSAGPVPPRSRGWRAPMGSQRWGKSHYYPGLPEQMTRPQLFSPPEPVGPRAWGGKTQGTRARGPGRTGWPGLRFDV